MADIKNYDPTDLASPLVGTPGVNQAAGSALSRYAQGVGEVRNQLSGFDRIISNRPSINYTLASKLLEDSASLKKQGMEGAYENAKQRMDLVPTIARAKAQQVGDLTHAAAQFGGSIVHAVASKVIENRKLQAQQVKLLQHTQAAQANYDAQLATHSAISTYKQKYVNNPEDAPSDLASLIDSTNAQAMQKFNDYIAKTGANPVAQAQLQAALTQNKNSALSHIQDWALSQGSKNEISNFDTAGDQAVQTVGGASGTIADKTEAYHQQLSAYLNRGDAVRGTLGDAIVSQKAKNIQRQMGVSFVQNLMADTKDDPEAELNYASLLKGMIQNSEKDSTKGGFGVYLQAEDKLHLLNLAESKATQAAKAFEQHLEVVQTRQDAFNIKNVFQEQVNRYPDNELEQKQALNFVDEQTRGLALKMRQVAANPLMPDSVKNAYMKTLTAKQGQLNTLANSAQSNLAGIKREALHEQKEDERQARQLAATAKAQEKEQNSAASKLAAAQLGKLKLETGLKVNDYISRLDGLDPKTQSKEITQLSTEFHDYAQHAAEAGLIPPEKARSYQKYALQATSGSIAVQNHPIEIFGWKIPGLVQSSSKPPNFQQKMNSKVQAERAVTTNTRWLADIQKQDAINHTIPGWTPAHDAKFHEKAELVRAIADKYGLTKADFDNRMNALRSITVQVLRNKAEAPLPRKLVKPPPAVEVTPNQLSQYPSNANQNIGDAGPGYAPGYPATHHLEATKYLTEPGNIDLSKRPLISNPESGSSEEDKKYQYGSEYSARERLSNGEEMVFPTIYDGKTHSVDEAFAHAKATHQHMGIFKKGTPNKIIEEYENALHSRDIYYKGRKMNGDYWKELHGG